MARSDGKGRYSIFAGTMVDLPYTEVAAAADRGALVLLPVGVVEEHGPHMPLGVDIYGSYVLATRTREELTQLGVESLVAPPFYWGINHVTGGFPGSFRTQPETARQLLIDIATSLATDGFRLLYVINHQGDSHHARMVLGVLDHLREEDIIEARWVADERTRTRFEEIADPRSWLPMREPEEADVPSPNPTLGVHAHDTETAMMQHWFPELVDEEVLNALEPTDLTLEDLEEWRRGGEHAVRVTPDGYFGDPKPRDPDLWRLYELRARGMASAIADDVSDVR